MFVADGVDGAVGVAVVVFDDFQDASGVEAFEGFGLVVRLSDLSKVEGEADRALNGFGEGAEIFLARSYPVDGFHGWRPVG